MRDLPPGWATDLAVLAQSGATVKDRGDHLLIRTPKTPNTIGAMPVLTTVDLPRQSSLPKGYWFVGSAERTGSSL